MAKGTILSQYRDYQANISQSHNYATELSGVPEISGFWSRIFALYDLVAAVGIYTLQSQDLAFIDEHAQDFAEWVSRLEKELAPYIEEYDIVLDGSEDLQKLLDIQAFAHAM